MFRLDGNHPALRRANKEALFAFLQSGIDEGRTGTESIYVHLDQKWYFISWDKLRLKYGRLKQAQPFTSQTALGGHDLR